eukprot:m.12971 g.12971  ORF g.12971 m.12971 type:complete len:275 (+) comp5885_c0_seq2:71-895(+)
MAEALAIKAKQIKAAESILLDNDLLERPPPSSNTIQSIYTHELKACIAQLAQVHLHTVERIAQVKQDIEREQEALAQHLAVASTLQEKLVRYQRQLEREQQEPIGEVVARYRERTTRMVQQNRSIMQALAKFMKKHFPAPVLDGETSLVTLANAKRAKRHEGKKTKRNQKGNQRGDGGERSGTIGAEDDDSDSELDDADEDGADQEEMGGTRYIALDQMLESLMNSSLAKPHDPYIKLDPATHWAPYTELLLRSGIARLHPKDAHKLKMTEFHV